MVNTLTSQSKRRGQRAKGDRTGQGPRVGHLNTMGAVVKEMAAVYREVRLGNTKPDIGCKLVYILRELRAAFEAEILERLEQRLQALEGSYGQQAYDIPALRAH